MALSPSQISWGNYTCLTLPENFGNQGDLKVSAWGCLSPWGASDVSRNSWGVVVNNNSWGRCMYLFVSVPVCVCA